MRPHGNRQPGINGSVLLRVVALTLAAIILMSGAASSASAAPPQQDAVYTVRPGDTLYKIWRATGTSVSDLVTLNGPTYPTLYSDPGKISPGWVFVLSPGASAPDEAPADSQGEPPAGDVTYVVKRGDYLTQISRETGTSVSDLIRLNSATYPSLITSPSMLYVGWVLKLAPGSTAPAVAPSSESAPAAPVATGRVERVLIISIDGLRPDALFATPAPNIHALANRGAYTWAAQTIDPPTTLQAHASMLSGMDVAGHGIDWNAFEPERGTIQVPTVFSIVHGADGHTVMVFSKNKLQHLAAPGTVDALVNLHDVGDPYVAERAAKLVGSDFDLMFVHMMEVDDFGHTNGWMSPNYLRGVTQADAAVGTILGALDGAGMTGTTLVIVTADHGGEGIDHQISTPATRTIPWVMAGPGVRAGYQVSGIRITDTAATAVYALGLGVPGNWIGRPVTEAFVN